MNPNVYWYYGKLLIQYLLFTIDSKLNVKHVKILSALTQVFRTTFEKRDILTKPLYFGYVKSARFLYLSDDTGFRRWLTAIVFFFFFLVRFVLQVNYLINKDSDE